VLVAQRLRVLPSFYSVDFIENGRLPADDNWTALVGPLAQAKVPVFVASTMQADLVLVPFERPGEAVDVLRAAGHEVDDGSVRLPAAGWRILAQAGDGRECRDRRDANAPSAAN
jgi:hypothetical protein